MQNISTIYGHLNGKKHHTDGCTLQIVNIIFNKQHTPNYETVFNRTFGEN